MPGTNAGNLSLMYERRYFSGVTPESVIGSGFQKQVAEAVNASEK
jgi:hypothetical protein